MDADLAQLLAELESIEGEVSEPMSPEDSAGDVFVPMLLETPFGRLSFLSTTTVFGSPNDVTLAEIAIENFFPADDATAAALAELSSRPDSA